MEKRYLNNLIDNIGLQIRAEIDINYYNDRYVNLDYILKNTAANYVVNEASVSNNKKELLRRYMFDYAESYHRQTFFEDDIEKEIKENKFLRNVTKAANCTSALFFGIIGFMLTKLYDFPLDDQLQNGVLGLMFGYLLEKNTSWLLEFVYPGNYVKGTACYYRKLKRDLKKAIINE